MENGRGRLNSGVTPTDWIRCKYCQQFVSTVSFGTHREQHKRERQAGLWEHGSMSRSKRLPEAQNYSYNKGWRVPGRVTVKQEIPIVDLTLSEEEDEEDGFPEFSNGVSSRVNGEVTYQFDPSEFESEESAADLSLLRCNTCNEYFFTKTDWLNHQLSYHEEEPSTQYIEANIDEEVASHEIGSKDFASKADENSTGTFENGAGEDGGGGEGDGDLPDSGNSDDDLDCGIEDSERIVLDSIDELTKTTIHESISNQDNSDELNRSRDTLSNSPNTSSYPLNGEVEDSPATGPEVEEDMLDPEESLSSSGENYEDQRLLNDVTTETPIELDESGATSVGEEVLDREVSPSRDAHKEDSMGSDTCPSGDEYMDESLDNEMSAPESPAHPQDITTKMKKKGARKKYPQPQDYYVQRAAAKKIRQYNDHICPYCDKDCKTASRWESHIQSKHETRSKKLQQQKQPQTPPAATGTASTTTSIITATTSPARPRAIIHSFPPNQETSLQLPKSNLENSSDLNNSSPEAPSKDSNTAPKEKVGKRRRGLSTHTRAQCQFCKVWITKSGMAYHLRIHTGEKPYTCRYCHVPFRGTPSLYRHEAHCGQKYSSYSSEPGKPQNNNKILSKSSPAKSAASTPKAIPASSPEPNPLLSHKRKTNNSSSSDINWTSSPDFHVYSKISNKQRAVSSTMSQLKSSQEKIKPGSLLQTKEDSSRSSRGDKGSIDKLYLCEKCDFATLRQSELSSHMSTLHRAVNEAMNGKRNEVSKDSSFESIAKGAVPSRSGTTPHLGNTEAVLATANQRSLSSSNASSQSFIFDSNIPKGVGAVVAGDDGSSNNSSRSHKDAHHHHHRPSLDNLFATSSQPGRERVGSGGLGPTNRALQQQQSEEDTHSSSSSSSVSSYRCLMCLRTYNGEINIREHIKLYHARVLQTLVRTDEDPSLGKRILKLAKKVSRTSIHARKRREKSLQGSRGSSSSAAGLPTDNNVDESVVLPRLLVKAEGENVTTCSVLYSLPDESSHKTQMTPFSCEFCSETFSTHESYLVHVIHHKGAAINSCDECGKIFMHTKFFREHMSRVHRINYKLPKTRAVAEELPTKTLTETVSILDNKFFQQGGEETFFDVSLLNSPDLSYWQQSDQNDVTEANSNAGSSEAEVNGLSDENENEEVEEEEEEEEEVGSDLSKDERSSDGKEDATTLGPFDEEELSQASTVCSEESDRDGDDDEGNDEDEEEHSPPVEVRRPENATFAAASPCPQPARKMVIVSPLKTSSSFESNNSDFEHEMKDSDDGLLKSPLALETLANANKELTLLSPPLDTDSEKSQPYKVVADPISPPPPALSGDMNATRFYFPVKDQLAASHTTKDGNSPDDFSFVVENDITNLEMLSLISAAVKPIEPLLRSHENSLDGSLSLGSPSILTLTFQQAEISESPVVSKELACISTNNNISVVPTKASTKSFDMDGPARDAESPNGLPLHTSPEEAKQVSYNGSKSKMLSRRQCPYCCVNYQSQLALEDHISKAHSTKNNITFAASQG